MKQYSSDSIFKPAMMLMIGRALGFLASFVIPIVLVRLFDQSEFGTYKQLFLIFGTLFGIAQLGMAESLFYFLPARSERGSQYVLNAVLTLCAAGGVCLVVLWAAKSAIASWLNNEALAGYMPLIGIYLLLMLMAVVLEIMMTACKRYLTASLAYALSDLSRAILYIAPVLLVGRLEWLLYGAIAFAAMRLAATLFYIRREYGVSVDSDTQLLRRQLAYAVPFGIAVVIEVLQANLHMYAVSFHFDAATFAVYAVGILQIPVFDLMMTSTANVMMVRMRERLHEGATHAVLQIWRDASRKLALIFFPLVGGLLVVADELIVVLFTGGYQRSVPVFMVWTLTLLLMALLTDAVLRVYAEIRYLIFLNIVKLVLIAGLIGWFLDQFALVGAVLVMFLATVVAKVIALARIRTLLRCRVAELLPWGALAKLATISAAAAAPAVGLKGGLELTALPLLLISGLVYSFTVLGLLLLFGPIKQEEKRELLSWVTSSLTRFNKVSKA